MTESIRDRLFESYKISEINLDNLRGAVSAAQDIIKDMKKDKSFHFPELGDEDSVRGYRLKDDERVIMFELTADDSGAISKAKQFATKLSQSKHVKSAVFVDRKDNLGGVNQGIIFRINP